MPLARWSIFPLIFAAAGRAWSAEPSAERIRGSVTFYASFDSAVGGDRGGGALKVSTRFNHETEKGRFVFEEGFDAGVFRIVAGAGVSAGALEATRTLPRNGRIFVPALGNLAYRKGGWAGSASFWLNTDPNRMLKSYSDPLQITERGASNGAIWCDFNDATPRDMRMGLFPAVPPRGKPIPESDPAAPIIWNRRVDFRAGDWHHVAMSRENLDGGRADATGSLYVDCELIGTTGPREIAMHWNLARTGIYFAVGYIGLMDELALFDRALTPGEVKMLRARPGLLRGRYGTSAPRAYTKAIGSAFLLRTPVGRIASGGEIAPLTHSETGRRPTAVAV